MVLPNRLSSDPKEAMLSRWLVMRRASKLGKGYKKFYLSDEKIAKSFGYADIWEQPFEKESNKKCHEVCQYKKAHNGKDPQDGSLGGWLNIRRRAKIGKEKNPFYESDQKIAEAYDYPMLFDQKDKEKTSNENCRKVCLWIKQKGKIPSIHSDHAEEKRLGAWLRNRIVGKNREGTFYESDEKIVISFGCSGLFDLKDLEKISNTKCVALCEWKKKHGNKNPSEESKDPKEKNWLSGL